ncbi:hypothetical protein A6I87_14975 [Prescottella equi]|uniref:hypothetical protein n=1 Tax=Rhodococcus hoagii TaxID=43767 RepID=UPI000A0F8C5A|nr:hypothetical protein [Prescottella equi]ORL34424.1 hypothetical protein A6I87_14975 [Prescottella equi]
MSTHLARRVTVGLAATAASAGMLLAAGPPAGATAGATTTNFSNACVGQASGYSPVHQIQPASVTVNHTSVAPTGSNNTYELQMGAQTTPGSSGLYTLVGLEQIKTVYSINPSTFVSASIVSGTGSGYTGTPQLTVSGSTLTLNGTGTTGLSVPASTTYQLPKIQIVTTNTNFDVKLNTAGTAAQYGNYSSDYFTFVSKATAFFGTVKINAPTSCIPADGPLGDGDIGNNPTLNAGAGTLH